MPEVRFNPTGVFGANATILLKDDGKTLVVEIEGLREEGRREILRQIAATLVGSGDPIDSSDVGLHCVWCRAVWPWEYVQVGTMQVHKRAPDPFPHASDCLWVRAQNA